MQENTPLPLRAYSYQLTSADALAWRKLRDDWSAWEKLFGLALACGLAVLLAALPESWIGAPYELRFVAAFAAIFAPGYGLFRLLIELNDRRLARRDIPAPRKIRLEDWGGHLDECWVGGRRFVTLEKMGPVLDAKSHIFVQGPGTVIIIPAAAFANAGDKRAFAANLEAKADAAGQKSDSAEDGASHAANPAAPD